MSTYKELYTQAKLLQIRGRSKMNKIQLQKAIEECIRNITKKKIYVRTCKSLNHKNKPKY